MKHMKGLTQVSQVLVGGLIYPSATFVTNVALGLLIAALSGAYGALGASALALCPLMGTVAGNIVVGQRADRLNRKWMVVAMLGAASILIGVVAGLQPPLPVAGVLWALIGFALPLEGPVRSLLEEKLPIPATLLHGALQTGLVLVLFAARYPMLTALGGSGGARAAIALLAALIGGSAFLAAVGLPNDPVAAKRGVSAHVRTNTPVKVVVAACAISFANAAAQGTIDGGLSLIAKRWPHVPLLGLSGLGFLIPGLLVLVFAMLVHRLGQARRVWAIVLPASLTVLGWAVVALGLGLGLPWCFFAGYLVVYAGAVWLPVAVLDYVTSTAQGVMWFVATRNAGIAFVFLGSAVYSADPNAIGILGLVVAGCSVAMIPIAMRWLGGAPSPASVEPAAADDPSAGPAQSEPAAASPKQGSRPDAKPRLPFTRRVRSELIALLAEALGNGELVALFDVDNTWTVRDVEHLAAGGTHRLRDDHKVLHPRAAGLVVALAAVARVFILTGQDLGMCLPLFGGSRLLNYYCLMGRQRLIAGATAPEVDPDLLIFGDLIETHAMRWWSKGSNAAETAALGMPMAPLYLQSVRPTPKMWEFLFEWDLPLFPDAEAIAGNAATQAATLAEIYGIVAVTGNGFVELRPPGAFNKGDAALRALKGVPANSVVLLAGDSLDDLETFRAARALLALGMLKDVVCVAVGGGPLAKHADYECTEVSELADLVAAFQAQANR